MRPVVVALLCSPLACGSSLPAPPELAQPANALVEVPYPPPPARVEFVPDAPRDDAVWIDGQWLWGGRRWSWEYGAWYVVPRGIAYCRWTTSRDRRGVLRYAPGRFRDARGAEVPPPKPLDVGRARETVVVYEDDVPAETGPSLSPRRSPAGTRAPTPPSPAERAPADRGSP